MKKILLFLIILVCCGCSLKKEPIMGCPDGYERDGEKCYKLYVERAKYTTTNYCFTSQYNEKLEGDECVYYVSTPAYLSVSCPYDYREFGSECMFKYGMYSNNCSINQVEYRGRCYQKYVSGTTRYSCTIGTLQGSNCVQRYSYPAGVNYNYYCDSGFTLDSEFNMCVKTEYKPLIERNDK